MSINHQSGFDSQVYYHKPIEFLKKCKKTKKELTREELSQFIIKSLKVKCANKVIIRLKELGYIEQENKKIIKFLK